MRFTATIHVRPKPEVRDPQGEAILGANGIRRIYISGVSTSGAVLSAAKEGHDRDYHIVVLEDCCCALTEEQHQSVIEQMQRIADITNSKDVQFG